MFKAFFIKNRYSMIDLMVVCSAIIALFADKLLAAILIYFGGAAVSGFICAVYRQHLKRTKSMNSYFVYGTATCPYCTKAIDLLKKLGNATAYIDITNRPELRNPEWKTVPQIYHITYDGSEHRSHYVGGYEDLIQYLKNQ